MVVFALHLYRRADVSESYRIGAKVLLNIVNTAVTYTFGKSCLLTHGNKKRSLIFDKRQHKKFHTGCNIFMYMNEHQLYQNRIPEYTTFEIAFETDNRYFE